MDDDQRGRGVSLEEAEQLRRLLTDLEEQVRNRQGQNGINELSTEIAKIRETVQAGNRTTLFMEIFKSVRSIAEGIVGATIYDLIPNGVKSSLKEELLGAPQDSRDVDDRRLYAIRVQIMCESVLAFQFAVNTGLPFAFTLNGLDMRIWCGPQLAAMLRLTLENSGIEYPAREDCGIRLHVLSAREAAVVKVWLSQVQEKVALAVLRVSGSSPEEAVNDALAELYTILPRIRP
ncbi:hypothetical protein [Acetobacter sp.]|uniref:hypothetical protein n=1 Tax=Acetobacter sp. TaxID=440 RepID=UPI0039EA98FE